MLTTQENTGIKETGLSNDALRPNVYSANERDVDKIVNDIADRVYDKVSGNISSHSDIVNQLLKGYQFMGIVDTPEDRDGETIQTPEQKQFYIITEAGEYWQFGGTRTPPPASQVIPRVIVKDGYIAVVTNEGSLNSDTPDWVPVYINISSNDIFLATYNITTYDELNEANDDGKLIICQRNSTQNIILNKRPNGDFYGYGIDDGLRQYGVWCWVSNGKWGVENKYIAYKSDIPSLVGLGFAANTMYEPTDKVPTYVEVLQRDGTTAVYSGPTKTSEDGYNLISTKMRNEVTQKRSVSNNDYPLAIAGKQFANMVDGNCLPIYYNNTATINPYTGVLKVKDIEVNGVSLAAVLAQMGLNQ